MPIFEYACPDCGNIYEAIMIRKDAAPVCPFCGGKDGEKVLSASSSMTGKAVSRFPGHGDHACCGSNPSEKGCTPGSCCGKA